MAIGQITVQELQALGPDVHVVDVRENDEWADGHIPYAQHVVLSTVPDRLEDFDGQPTYVICRGGGRSLSACDFAAAQGKQVVNVAGGILAWIEAGYPIEVGA